MTQRGSLTTQQAKYVSMVSQGHTHSDIAKSLGVARKTIIRWSQLEQVKSAIAEAQAGSQRGIAQAQEERYKEIAKSATQTSMELIEKFTPSAIKVVAMILAKPEAKDSDRLKAAELLAKWSGIGQTANQPQQSAELTLKQYLVALETKNHAN